MSLGVFRHCQWDSVVVGGIMLALVVLCWCRWDSVIVGGVAWDSVVVGGVALSSKEWLHENDLMQAQTQIVPEFALSLYF